MIERSLLERALPAYEIGDELGRGGFGVVLAGRHRRLGRDVAIKQLPRAFGADSEMSRRFLAEAQMLARLDHPHIVPVYDYVEHDGMFVLVMEKMGGGSLGTRLRTNGIDAPLACCTVIAVLSALDRAHRAGVLHRDIKPDNVLFGESGVVKVADFGIAKVISAGAQGLTRTGEILGTPTYMAPEHLRGGELTGAADLYAVAVMLYELLAGAPPFSSEGGAIAVLYKHTHEPPPPLPDHVPRAIAAVIERGLAKEPSDRFAGAEDMAVALGTAATQCWGGDWTEALRCPLVAPPRVLRTLVGPPSRDTQPSPLPPPLPLATTPFASPPPFLATPPPPPPFAPPPPPPPPPDPTPPPPTTPPTIAVDDGVERAVAALLERLDATSLGRRFDVRPDDVVVVLGRAGLPLRRAWCRIASDDDDLPPVGTAVVLDGGGRAVWAAPLAVGGAQPAIVAEALAATLAPVVVLCDAAGLTDADRALRTLVPNRSVVRPLVMDDDLVPAPSAEVVGIGREVSSGHELWAERHAMVTALNLVHVERQLTLHLLQDRRPWGDRDVRAHALAVLAADRARIIDTTEGALHEAATVSVATISAALASIGSTFEAAALRGTGSIDAVDGALATLVGLGRDLTATWQRAELAVATLIDDRIARLAPQLAGEPPRAIAATTTAKRAGRGYAAVPALALLPTAASLQHLRARLVAAAGVARPTEQHVAAAVADDASTRLLAAAAHSGAVLEPLRERLEAWSASWLDDVTRWLDHGDTGLMAALDSSIDHAGASVDTADRRDAALDALADLEEIDALLARIEGGGR